MLHLDKNDAGVLRFKYSKHFVSAGNSYQKPSVKKFHANFLPFVLKGLNSLHDFHTFHISWKGKALRLVLRKYTYYQSE